MAILDIEHDKKNYNELLLHLTQALDRNYDQAIEELTRKVVFEREIAPWPTAFRDYYSTIKAPDIIVDSLLKLSKSDDYIRAYGAVYLLAEINKLHENATTIKEVLEKFKNAKYKDLRFTIYIKMLQYYLAGNDYQTANQIVDEMLFDEALAIVAADLKSYIEIPFENIILAMSNGNIKAFEQFEHFLTHSKTHISRIANCYSRIYKNCNPDQKDNLIGFIDRLVSTKTGTQRTFDFISQIFGDDALYVKYKEYIKPLWASEKLRVVIHRSSDEHVQRSLIKRIMSYKATREDTYALAARGSVKELSESTLNHIFEIIKTKSVEHIAESILIPEEIPDLPDEEKAQYILSSCNQFDKMPVQVEMIAKSYNIATERMASSDKFDGCLIRADGMLYPIILINTEQWPATRVRFTICHELSHYFLPAHKEYAGFCGTEWEIRNDSNLEREADSFASKLIIPKKHLDADIRRGITPWVKIRRLMDKYEVSKLAMLMRALEFIEEPPTILYRFNNGICDLRRFSKNFPYELQYATFLSCGDCLPEKAGAHGIDSMHADEIEMETPLNIWLKVYDDSLQNKYKAREYSTKYGQDRILTLIELYSSDSDYYDEDNEVEAHLDYSNSHKKFRLRPLR